MSTTSTTENNTEFPQKAQAKLPHYVESKTMFTMARKAEERGTEISS